MSEKMKKLVVIMLVLVIGSLIVGCTSPVKHYTPSGRPEITINGKVSKQVQAEIMNLMLNNGYDVKTSLDVLLVFEQPIKNVLAATLLGSRYDSTPAARVSFSIIEMETSTRVVASFAAITNPGSAFERITPLNNNPDTANFQMRLNEIKQKIEETECGGTTIGVGTPTTPTGGPRGMISIKP